MRLRSHLAACAAVALAACGQSNPSPPGGSGDRQAPTEPTPAPRASDPETPAQPPPVTRVTLADLGIEVDPDIDPCADFYGYVCGRYAAAAPPKGRASWSRLDDARSAIEERAGALLEADASPAGQLYRQCTQKGTRDLAALAPLRELARGVSDQKSLSRALGTLHRHRIWAGFSIAAAPSFRDGRKTVAHLDRHLTLGDRAYYLEAKDATDRGEDFDRLRRDYEKLVADAMELAGADAGDARKIADDVVRLERELAELARSQYERRLPELLDDPVTADELRALAKQVDWDAYFAALGGSPKQLNLTGRRYIDRLASLAKSQPDRRWQRYLEWQIVWHMAPAIGGELAQVRRRIEALVGAPPTAPSCARQVADAMPVRVAALLAGKRLPEKRAARLVAVVDALVEGHAVRAEQAGWLTDKSRAAAAAKLREIDRLLGAPPAGGMAEAKPSYLAALLAARAAQTERELAAIKSGDASFAHVDPLSPGVRYDWLGNRLVVGPGAAPLALLGEDAPVAAAVGALAASAGHELFHAIDARGADWNQRGGTGRWWNESDKKGYREAAACVIDRAKKVRGVDGAAVVAESLADRAGIAAGWLAYQKLANADAGRIELDGVTADKLYFLAAAHQLCERGKPVAGNRGPARWRVNRAFADAPEFATAFQCAAKTAMNPADRCR